MALLAWLVDQTPYSELREQLASVRAVAGCSCGCLSIDLETDGPPLSAATMRAHNAVEMKAYYEDLREPMPDIGPRDDYLDVTAYGRNREGREITVIIKVVFGRLGELEIWTPDTEHTQTDIPDVSTLRLPDFD